MLELDDFFTEKLMKELKEVENIEKWEIVEYKTNSSPEVMKEVASEESEDY